MAGWRVWVDTGGTFTDAVGVDPAGARRRIKVLSSGVLRGRLAAVDGAEVVIEQDWEAPPGLLEGFRLGTVGAGEHADAPRITSFDPDTGRAVLDRALGAPGALVEAVGDEPAPVLAARLLTGTPAGATLPVDEFRLATTWGTNALLERKGARTALFVTDGFGDLLVIGTQARPDIFDLRITRPAPLPEAAVEVPGRRAADGAVVAPLDADAVRPEAARLVAAGVRSAAVALLHSHADPADEHALAAVLREEGFEHVACSADLAPFLGLLDRARTAAVEAVVGPVLAAHLERVADAAPTGALRVMTSAGGLAAPGDFRAKDGLLSGPAGGVVGARMAGRRSGRENVIAFDMGGTSTDVSRISGDYDHVFEHTVGDAEVRAPALGIATVAAGGGSICSFDGDALKVGPESAGADPGPACYGRGGPLTLTDVNLLLGRLDPDHFHIPVSRDAAAAAFEPVASAVRAAGAGDDPDALLRGFVAIADERMADAIRGISLRRGFDPAEHALVAFGGAGGQHACGTAERLGIRTVIVPADASVLSAVGLGHAVVERFAERQVLRPLADAAADLPDLCDALAAEARAAVAASLRGGDPEAAPDTLPVRRRIVRCRLVGQDTTLDLDWEPGRDPVADFAGRWRAAYGYDPGDRPAEIESVRVAVAAPEPPPAAADPHADGFPDPTTAPDGATLLRLRHSTAVVPPGWSARRDDAGAVVCERDDEPEGAEANAGDRADAPAAPADAPDAVRLELFTHRFRALAEEMGERLRRTALSVNIKERLDFSCAVLDPGGMLVVNAPHIPVHLGALGLCIRGLAGRTDAGPGDVVVTNHPAFGGSHLPDITVAAPVADDDGGMLGWVACRAHHAELGGTRPGSMPPDARTLAEEGVVIPPTVIVRDGRADWDAARRLFTDAPHPSRAPDDNLADLRAMVAAVHGGAEGLRALAGAHGTEEVVGHMRALTALAGRRARAALDRVRERLGGPGPWECDDRMDDGAAVRVRVALPPGAPAVVDFAGSADVHPGNLNCTPAVVRSAVLYVLRVLVDEPLPLNEGLMEAVDLRIPPGMLNPDFPDDPGACPAVVGGNVETSQRIVDVLLRALQVGACSQGTMNNVLFGGDDDGVGGWYETVCGGAGAGPDWDGASAVHVHMTNTRITDAEILEFRRPVRVERFAVRRGSGGAGAHPGGDGAVRVLRFLAPMRLSLLAQRRALGPPGAAGGEDGAPGRQHVERADGTREDLPGIAACDVGPGDALVLETPGGGGWGAPTDARAGGSGDDGGRS